MPSLEEIRLRVAPHHARFKEMHVAALLVFGSTVRGEANAQSDVDFVVDFDRPVSLFDVCGVAALIEDIFQPQPVDVIDRGSLRPELRDEVLAEAVRIA